MELYNSITQKTYDPEQCVFLKMRYKVMLMCLEEMQN